MKPFPCVSCGACRRHVDFSEETRFLDRGDGVCRDYDEETRLRRIYEDRPAVCRVDLRYAERFAATWDWDAFCEANLKICATLQALEARLGAPAARAEEG